MRESKVGWWVGFTNPFKNISSGDEVIIATFLENSFGTSILSQTRKLVGISGYDEVSPILRAAFFLDGELAENYYDL